MTETRGATAVVRRVRDLGPSGAGAARPPARPAPPTPRASCGSSVQPQPPPQDVPGPTRCPGCLRPAGPACSRKAHRRTSRGEGGQSAVGGAAVRRWAGRAGGRVLPRHGVAAAISSPSPTARPSAVRPSRASRVLPATLPSSTAPSGSYCTTRRCPTCTRPSCVTVTGRPSSLSRLTTTWSRPNTERTAMTSPSVPLPRSSTAASSSSRSTPHPAPAGASPCTRSGRDDGVRTDHLPRITSNCKLPTINHQLSTYNFLILCLTSCV